MDISKIKNIVTQFHIQSPFKDCEKLTSGHINDTYLIRTQKKPFYVLQQINHFVFKNIDGLISNKIKISQHLKATSTYTSLEFIPTSNHNYYHKDNEGNYWNLMHYIDKNILFNVVPNKKIAFEAGKLFGDFLNATSNFDISKLIEPIPNFHNMEFRFLQFYTALQNATEERKQLANEQIKKVYRLKKEMLVLHQLKKSGKFNIRVTHNDTKISNALFSKDNDGLCVIDLDTVMPGIIHYDYGDAIRTICSTAKEDETDLSKVKFNLSYFEAFSIGFLNLMKGNISTFEASYLPLSAKTMTFIMGLRMLTDFLNNDIYYKTTSKLHNLDRAKNQFQLIKEMKKEFKAMQRIISQGLN